MPNQYTIADLARLTGVNVRTIRYYLAQGLLPASGESGPGAHYGDGHLDRLRLTRRLQEQHLPLAEIRRRLAQLTDVQIAEFLAAPVVDEDEARQTSALEYVRSLLGPAADVPPAVSAPPPTSMLQPATSMPMAAHLLALPAAMPQSHERSQWERLSLGPNVEIHIRRPLSRIEQRRVERLITIARQVLKEDKP